MSEPHTHNSGESGEQTPPVCKCGFFGNRLTMNLCSSCYREYLERNPDMKAKETESAVVASVQSSVVDRVETSVVPSAAEQPRLDGGAKPRRAPARCHKCNRKVGVTGFTCKCGDIFCSAHRHFVDHDCPFDYAGIGKKKLEQANPVVLTKKIDHL